MFFIKRWLRTFMGFSKAESNGFVILLPLITIIVLSEPLTRLFIGQRKDDFSKEQHILDSLVQLTSAKEATLPRKEAGVSNSKPIAFNPNHASYATLCQLGFPNVVASRVVKYRDKGGKFMIKSDLMKIYGVDSALYRNLYAFILLPDSVDKQPAQGAKAQNNNIAKKVEEFDLNTADTIQLKTIYGIGSTLANRIVKYRQRIGGFVHTGQLKEVYGLDSTVIHNLLKRSFLYADFQPVKINLNTCTEKEFQTHPYVTKAMAKAIVTYRFQHGNFTKVEEIKNLQSINATILDKLIPYLKVNE